MPSDAVIEAVSRLARRDPMRTEADLQADIYLILIAGGLSLSPWQVARLEVPTSDGTRRRIDVEVGHCVIEVKRDLRIAGVRRDAEKQLAGYVQTQSNKLGTRYVGILTDGATWHLYHVMAGRLVEVTELVMSANSPDSERLLVWLEAVLATQELVAPVPLEIQRRLGADSPAYKLDHASLKAMYEAERSNPEIILKRNLWAKLLRTAFGKAFTDDEDLFIDHTLLVLTAEVIAHAVVGFDVSRAGDLDGPALARGVAFSAAQIHGVVEADFFDWVLHADGGADFVIALADRISRFNWAAVEHDVLKVLYESVIPAEARASLGEYYTPDWLAERMVEVTIGDPYRQRVLDPACGSGTFLFYAIRAFLAAAEEAGVPNGRALTEVTEHVFGMDVHPVAVTLARVTYLLAIGRHRLASSDRGPLSVPVYLGDSIQWEQRRDLLSGADSVTIATSGDDLVEGGGLLFGDDLVFPRNVLHDAGDFDRLVSAMADKATASSAKSSKELVAPVLRQFGVHPHDVATLSETFDTMRRLHSSGRNHIWGYYVRNLIRPLWLSELDQRVDVLIGNPPWLRYSKMTASMQERYKALAKDRGLLTGALGAAGRDLSTLFVTRAVELYLRSSGRFSFVMPHGILTRKPHDGFRSGRWSSDDSGNLNVRFEQSWDLSEATTGFPMVSCVVHGELSSRAGRVPQGVLLWSARLPSPNVSWARAQAKFRITERSLSVLDSKVEPTLSPYKSRFRNGAILYPRFLLFVVEEVAGPLGSGAGRVAVTSRRTTTEKAPWRDVPSLKGTVESIFVREVHLGETLLPFRMTDPLRAVLPVTTSGILTQSQIDSYAGLAAWWDTVEQTWERYKVAGDKSRLVDRIDYHGQLRAQLPAARHRVLYTASGNTLAAARISTPAAIIEHKLYWMSASSVGEARYLTAVLNSPVVLARVAPLQALGLFGPRDFDKNVFNVPIPTYDPTDADHVALSRLAERAEEVSAFADIASAGDFKKARKVVREALSSSGISHEIDLVVARVIPLIAIDADTLAPDSS